MLCASGGMSMPSATIKPLRGVCADKDAAALVVVDEVTKASVLVGKDHATKRNWKIISRVHHAAFERTGEECDIQFQLVRGGDDLAGLALESQREVIGQRWRDARLLDDYLAAVGQV